MKINRARLGYLAAGIVMILLAPVAFAQVCMLGECSAMTTEFRNLELRPTTIALLPPETTLKKKKTFSSEEMISESAMLEASLTNALSKRITELGYELRIVTLEDTQADDKLAALMTQANQRYNEEYSKIVAFKVSGVKYRRYSVGADARILADYLNVDAVAFPRMQAVGHTTFSFGGSGSINMEFGIVHARTGDIEGFFGAVNIGGPFSGGKSIKSILKKPDKHMRKIVKTSTKKMPAAGKALKPENLDITKIRALELHDPMDEEDMLSDLEALLAEPDAG